MISVIIPSYNHADQLPKTLNALLEQDYKDVEIIVVNDGSTDNTDEVIKPFLNRITYIKQENGGAPRARNNGFSHSAGDYLMFCDADLQLEPHALRTLLEALRRRSECSYAYYSFWWGKRLFKGRPFDAELLRKQPYIHTSALIRREHFPEFDVSLKKFQDWDLWLTMLEAGYTGCFVDEVLGYIEPHRGGISTWVPSFMYKIPWKLIGWRPRVIEKYENGMTVA